MSRSGLMLLDHLYLMAVYRPDIIYSDPLETS